MLNNIKFDPFNPSNNNTIHKKHSLCQPSKCVHINGKVDTHLDQVSAHADTSNNHKNEEAFIVSRHTVVDQRRFFSKIWLIDDSLPMKG